MISNQTMLTNILTSFQALNNPVFFKDKAGRYLWANPFFIECSAGFSSLSDIMNKKDTDFPWHEYASELRLHDEAVLEMQQSQRYFERIRRHNGNQVNIITQKTPVFDNNLQLIGLMGCSIAVPERSGIQNLSPREEECVFLLTRGFTDKKIAQKLMISPRTVETYISIAKEKFGVGSRAELIASFCRMYPGYP